MTEKSSLTFTILEGMPKNFESSGNDVMGGSAALSSFGPS